MEDNNKPNIQKSMLLNAVKTFFAIVFPLITYPYATRVLQVENFGKITYGQSLISYFALIAALGIASYAIREGGACRSDQSRLNRFCSEVFTINIVTTIIAYACLIVLICLDQKSQSLWLLLSIQSISILFTTIGVDWLNVIFEDYMYITIRSFVIQLFFLVCLFLFVKTPNDYYIYAGIQVAGNAIISTSNWFHLRKKCQVRVVWNCKVKKHLPSIMVLFSNSLAVSIYLNSDNVMLGYFVGEYFVGIYAVSVKIYTVLKQLVAAVYDVVVARMSEYYAKGQTREFKSLLNDVLNHIIVIAIPITIGLICTAKTLVFFIAGDTYISAALSLQILACAILVAVLGGALAYGINLPIKREKNNLFATAFGAIENIVLNLFLIPIFKIEGAAVTTLISECSVFAILMIGLKDYFYLFDFKRMMYNILKCSVSAMPIVIIRAILNYYYSYQSFIALMIEIVLSVISYFLINIALKNYNIQSLFGFLKTKKSL